MDSMDGQSTYVLYTMTRAHLLTGGVSFRPPMKSERWGFVFWMIFLSSVIIDMLSALDLVCGTRVSSLTD